DPVNLPQSTLDPIQGPVTVNGAGNTTLNVNDAGTSSHEWYDISASQVLRFPWTFGQPLGNPTQTINYFNVGLVKIYGGGAGDVFRTDSTLPGTTVSLNGGDSGPNGKGDNEFIVLNAADTLDDIHGPVAIHGGSVYDFAD